MKMDKANITDYSVISRLNVSIKPAAFLATKASPLKGAFNENVATVSTRVLNKNSMMLKVGRVQALGAKHSCAWELLSDEGIAGEQSALNPLSYMLAGVSSSLLTHLEQAIKIMNLLVSDVKVEAVMCFRYDDPMTAKWKGFTDSLLANILINSDEPVEKILELKRMAVKAWAIGECIKYPTPVDASFVFNSDIWDTEYPCAGNAKGADSYDDGLRLTSNGKKLEVASFTPAKDVSNKLTNPFNFEVVGVAESADDAQRPHLHKIRVRSLNENYTAWDVYADDSHGYEGVEKAPSSSDYFSVGTSLCLMSQLTANQMFYKKQGLDINAYRVEHQFNFQIDEFMTPSAYGHVDSVTTRILVKADVSNDILNDFASQSLRMCFAGDAVLDATPTVVGTFVNGKEIK